MFTCCLCGNKFDTVKKIKVIDNITKEHTFIKEVQYCGKRIKLCSSCMKALVIGAKLLITKETPVFDTPDIDLKYFRNNEIPEYEEF